MKTVDAERKGFTVKRKKQPVAEKPKPVEKKPVEQPVEQPRPEAKLPAVNVTVQNDNSAIAQALEPLIARIEMRVAEEPARDTEVIIESIRRAIRTKEPGKRIVSCDMEHKYDNRQRTIKTHVEFNYE